MRADALDAVARATGTSMIQRAREHLRRNRMTYTAHMRFAASHGAACIRAGIMLLIHSLAPCWFERAGSNLVRRLRESFDRHEMQRDCKGDASSV